MNKIIRNLFLFALATSGALAFGAPATDNSAPHLELRHGVKQLVVDGKPFLMLAGELGNSASSSAAWMKPIWPQLAQRNLNTVLAVISWQMIEPVEGKFDFSSVDNCLEGARASHLHLVILWFGSWKNGESSYQPDWVKSNPQRFPWAKDGNGNTLNIISTFGDATRDADAKAFAALMRHIREVDGKQHTVLMMQVENEVGVLRDSRDHVPAANAAYARPVPRELMNYLVQHKATLAPELLDVWAANGNKTSGTWEEVFGPGKSAAERQNSPEVTPEMRNTLWRRVTWGSDEFFMAWRYSMYLNKVAAAGKAEYNIPMYCNTWLQQPTQARPGEYPSGGPQPQVHDIWRFYAPNIDILAPDLYIPQFEDTCARFTRNGNPLFVPETSAGGAGAKNLLTAIITDNGIGFSPFGIERSGSRGGFGGRGQPMPGANEAPTAPTAPPPDALAQTYAILQYLAPVILDNQGRGTMVFLNDTTDTNAAPQEVKLGDYTLTFKYGVRTDNGGGRGGRGGRGGGGGFGGGGGGGGSIFTNVSPIRLLINTGPGAYVFVGGPMTVTFKANDPARGKVVLSSTIETINQNGQWLPGRWLNGDETSNNMRTDPENPGIYMGTFGVYGYSVFQRN